MIFTNSKLYDDVALIITTKMKKSIVLDNGLTYLDGPFLSTSSKNNILKTLNFKNSFAVYKEIVENDSGIKLTKENFNELSKYYPIAIEKSNSEMIIRDAIKIDEENNIVLVGDVFENSTINIFKCDKKSILESSLESITKKISKTKNKFLMFNCLSRKNLLEEKFYEELNSIQSKLELSKNLFGALTLGDIINSNGCLNFNNKSCSLTVLD